jgi:hypothetical protein
MSMTNQVFDVDDPCPNQPSAYENKQAAELYRDARLWRENQQALADVRTLDEWHKRTGKPPFRTEEHDGHWLCHSPDEHLDSDGHGPTPDAARAKAASWVREQGK